MLDIAYEINGKKYAEDEIISIYQFWLKHCDTEDINDAINHVIDYGYDKELSCFVKTNSEMVRNACIEHLTLWHNIQRNTLNSWEETIFDFALQLIDCIYYDKEGNLPN